MTIEERLNRIEHFSAVADEQRRKDRETDRALWRDTQQQLNDLALKLADLGDRIAEIAEESRAEDRRLAGRIDERPAIRARDQATRPHRSHDLSHGRIHPRAPAHGISSRSGFGTDGPDPPAPGP